MNPRMQGFERETVSALMNRKLFWLLYVVVNALLMLSFFYWTRIPEETRLQFSWSLISALLIALVTLWLHCATFEYFRAKPNLRAALRRSIHRVPAFLVWAVIFGVGLWFIGQLWDYDEQIGGWVRHLLPAFLRHAVTPRTAFSVTSWLIWSLYFIIWPMLLLPVGAQVALKNFRGFYISAAFRPFRQLRFWMVYLACFLAGAYLPYKLVWMTPTKPSSMNTQIWSMVIRFGAAYLLVVTAWLLLCAAIVRDSDGETELVTETAPKPAPAPVP